MDLKDRIKQRKFNNPGQEAVLNIIAASSVLRDKQNSILHTHGLSAQQYNILRILKGGPKEGFPRCEIYDRMVDKAPDITRLIDRMEKAQLVVRIRSDNDRRQSIAQITEKGIKKLEEVTPYIRAHELAVEKIFTKEEIKAIKKISSKIFVFDDK
jgi:DNA-binding MarR family transcriptional regulator